MSVQSNDTSAPYSLIGSVHSDRVRDWLPELPKDVAKSLLANKRLQPELEQIIARHYKFTAQMPNPGGEDGSVIALPYSSLEKVIRVAGLIWHSQYLRTLIYKQDLVRLLEGADEDAYRIAMSHSDLRPTTTDGSAETETLTSAAIWRDGSRCFFAWSQTLPAACQERIALRLPPDFAPEPIAPSFKKFGPEIIRKVGRELSANVSK